jgi:hypothetical protein
LQLFVHLQEGMTEERELSCVPLDLAILAEKEILE